MLGSLRIQTTDCDVDLALQGALQAVATGRGSEQDALRGSVAEGPPVVEGLDSLPAECAQLPDLLQQLYFFHFKW